MPNKVKPREPFLLRRVPSKYYEDHQLASVIQSVEAMLTALCFNQYPQAFMTLYGGIEKLCKNVAKIDRRQNFWKSLQAASEVLNLENHDLLKKENKRYIYQHQWSEFRNEFEHHGDSPSFDLNAANLILGEAWETFQLILLKGKGYDIEEAFLPETLNAFKLSKETKVKINKTSTKIDYPYFMNPLVSHLRSLLSGNFAPAQFNHDRYFNSDQYMEDLEEFKNKWSDEAWDWERIKCPACGEIYGQIGFKIVTSEDENLFLFSVFTCPSECRLVIPDHSAQPFLAEICLAESLYQEMNRIKKIFSLDELEIRWANLEAISKG